MERKVCMGAQKVGGRCAKGVRRCAKRCTIVHKRYARCAQVHERRRQVCRWGRSPGRVGRWSGWYGCMPSAPRGENSKIFKCVPVLTGLTAKNRLRVDWRGVGIVAQGQGMDGGCAK